MKRFALYEDLKKLNEKVFPVLSEYQKTMYEFQTEHMQMKEIIRRYDETFTTKANKTDIYKLRETKADQEDMVQFQGKMND